MKSHTG